MKKLAAMVGVTKDTVRNWEKYVSIPLRRDSHLSVALDILQRDRNEMETRFLWKRL
jgi:DNA-binding transcriptional regulator YiaG